MRQFSLWLLVSLPFVAVAQNSTPAPVAATAQVPESEEVLKARQEIAKISALVESGALPRMKLEDAQQALADAQDDMILRKTLYSDAPMENLDEHMADDMVAAAQRRLDREQHRLAETQQLVDQGIAAQGILTPYQEELKNRELNLSLARSRAKLISELAGIQRYEQDLKSAEDATHLGGYRDFPSQGMERFDGRGVFLEGRDLRPLQVAFTSKFQYSLPISADGETDTHRALGFDHRGRVDVALNPDQPEGKWLRSYLRAHGIPFYAFWRAMPGKATAAHIHIGPGSTRLHTYTAAD